MLIQRVWTNMLPMHLNKRRFPQIHNNFLLILMSFFTLVFSLLQNLLNALFIISRLLKSLLDPLLKLLILFLLLLVF